MSKTQMLINFVPGEECRIALTEDGRLEEFYQERASTESHVGSIYKGRVSNIEPAIQAAFIDFGLERNGFLHISDLHPMYFPGADREETEVVGLKTPRRERPPIQRCLTRGQEILVQVIKEGIGTKGPTVTSYLSIPGRYLVMMPYMERLGVSRKIEDDDARRESRKILEELDPPEGFGFIIRTAGIGKNKTELKRDLSYLVRLWKALERRMKTQSQVGELYTESDLLIRTLRDVFSSDIDRIILDDPTAARRARDFLAIANPRSASKVFLYQDHIPLFHRFDIERQIENIHARTVPLPSGGSLVIDQAEAMVAIDVNSGKFRDNRDAETTAYKTDLEACDEICRQLRLRDLGGVVVVDMIDMHQAKHRRDVETRFRNNLKKDRARTQVLPISRFGIIEMTRQRMRPSLTKSAFAVCQSCRGEGHVKTAETVVLEVMRRLALAVHRNDVERVELTVSPDVAFQLLNRKRSELVALERRHKKPVMVRVNSAQGIDFIEITCLDARGSVLANVLPGNKLASPTLIPVESDFEIPLDPEDENDDDFSDSLVSDSPDSTSSAVGSTREGSVSENQKQVSVAESGPLPQSSSNTNNLESATHVAGPAETELAPPMRPGGSTGRSDRDRRSGKSGTGRTSSSSSGQNRGTSNRSSSGQTTRRGPGYSKPAAVKTEPITSAIRQEVVTSDTAITYVAPTTPEGSASEDSSNHAAANSNVAASVALESVTPGVSVQETSAPSTAVATPAMSPTTVSVTPTVSQPNRPPQTGRLNRNQPYSGHHRHGDNRSRDPRQNRHPLPASRNSGKTVYPGNQGNRPAYQSPAQPYTSSSAGTNRSAPPASRPPMQNLAAGKVAVRPPVGNGGTTQTKNQSGGPTKNSSVSPSRNNPQTTQTKTQTRTPDRQNRSGQSRNTPTTSKSTSPQRSGSNPVRHHSGNQANRSGTTSGSPTANRPAAAATPQNKNWQPSNPSRGYRNSVNSAPRNSSAS